MYLEADKFMNKVTRTTTIQTISAKPGQRLIVVSDIHGSLDRLIQLLRKVKYTENDILVIVGDLIDKGPESLRVVQYVMELCSRYPVYVSMGNVDMGRLLVLEEEAEKFSGYIHWLDGAWGGGLFIDMLADMGVSVSHLNEQNAAEYKERMCAQFEKELDFLRSRPTILTAGDYLFVHGGVPTDDLSLLEGTDAAQYLKNDNFLNQGYRFEKYHVVTGHWPVCLYREDEENNSPLFDYERGILCIDGGCGLKRADSSTVFCSRTVMRSWRRFSGQATMIFRWRSRRSGRAQSLRRCISGILTAGWNCWRRTALWRGCARSAPEKNLRCPGNG